MLGQYAVGWFIAAEESLHLTLDTAGTSGNAHINGYQIREVPLAAFEQIRRAGSLATATNDSVSSPAAEKSYPGEVFDAEGKRIFYAEYGKHITAPDSPIYGPGRTYSEQILTHEASGRSFRLGQKRNEILSDGLVFMLYHFNDRHFEWIEAAGKMPLSTQTHEHDSAARVYEVTTPSAYQQAVSARYVDPRFEFWTVPEQGETPILAQEAVSANYLHGKFTSSKGAIKNFVFPEFTKSELMNDRFRLYRDEFGDPVYLIRGHLGADGNRTFGDWCDAVILHYYYEQNYQSTALESVKERRAVAAASLSESNSYAEEILNLSKKAETGATRVWGRARAAVYFTMIDGKVVYLSKEQVSAIKNKWLVLNEDTIRRSTPSVIPRGSHYLKKKEVKSRSIENANKGIVLEIKIKPEYMSQFRAALDW